MTTASDPEHDEEEELREHLESVEDGCGCAEVWEHLSEGRDGDA